MDLHVSSVHGVAMNLPIEPDAIECGFWSTTVAGAIITECVDSPCDAGAWCMLLSWSLSLEGCINITETFAVNATSARQVRGFWKKYAGVQSAPIQKANVRE